jgi:hypothetical protein
MQIKLHEVPIKDGEITIMLPTGATVLGAHDCFLVVHADCELPPVERRIYSVIGADECSIGIKAYRYLGTLTRELPPLFMVRQHLFERLP